MGWFTGLVIGVGAGIYIAQAYEVPNIKNFVDDKIAQFRQWEASNRKN